VNVVDASVWVSRVVPADTHHPASRAWLDREIEGGNLLVAPALLLAEVAAAISRRTARPRLARRVTAELERIPEIRLVSMDGELARAAALLAADLGLRGADAIYVAVARRLRLPLVTWDGEQRDRGRRVVRIASPDLA
jgi:predicted nucleic acid-binding protein